MPAGESLRFPKSVAPQRAPRSFRECSSARANRFMGNSSFLSVLRGDLPTCRGAGGLLITSRRVGGCGGAQSRAAAACGRSSARLCPEFARRNSWVTLIARAIATARATFRGACSAEWRATRPAQRRILSNVCVLMSLVRIFIRGYQLVHFAVPALRWRVDRDAGCRFEPTLFPIISSRRAETHGGPLGSVARR